MAPRERQTAVIDGSVVRDGKELRVPGLQFAAPDDDLLVVGIIFRRVDVFDAEAFVKNERAAFHVPAGVGSEPERFGQGDLALILFNVALKVQGFDGERSGEKLQLIIAVVVVAGLRNGQIVKGIVALENRERAFGSTVIEMGFADHQVLETVEGAAVELKIREDQNLIVDGIGARVFAAARGLDVGVEVREGERGALVDMNGVCKENPVEGFCVNRKVRCCFEP